MMTNTTNELEKEIRKICTYHGDEGTSGYWLSEEQFSQLFDLLADQTKRARVEEREKLTSNARHEWQYLTDHYGCFKCGYSASLPDDTAFCPKALKSSLEEEV